MRPRERSFRGAAGSTARWALIVALVGAIFLGEVMTTGKTAAVVAIALGVIVSGEGRPGLVAHDRGDLPGFRGPQAV